MEFQPLPLQGLVLIRPRVFEDPRGFFFESYRKDKFAEAGIDLDFPQDNHSRSCRGTVRGLHYQSTPGQAKLVRCILGRIWDVAVDIRPDSPTFGQWHGVELSAESKQLLFIPIGFAHGFSVLSEFAEVHYKCSAVYNAETESGIMWNDPDIAVDWKAGDPIISQRDRGNVSFAEFRRMMGEG